jgi:mannosyltransferase OCH1-like enzyme
MIAKNIFQSWHTTQLNPQIQYRIECMKHMNPEYKHKIYTDAEIDAFVNEKKYNMYNKTIQHFFIGYSSKRLIIYRLYKIDFLHHK